MDYSASKKEFQTYNKNLQPLHGITKSCSNFDIIPKKKHFAPQFSERKLYDFHTKIVKNSKGNPLMEKLCRDEYYIEKIMGSKKRIESLEKQRNFMAFANMGDKHYPSPERSKDFYKQSFVHSSLYGQHKKFDRRTLREQLGPVQGIFTSIMENKPSRFLASQISTLSLPIKH